MLSRRISRVNADAGERHAETAPEVPRNPVQACMPLTSSDTCAVVLCAKQAQELLAPVPRAQLKVEASEFSAFSFCSCDYRSKDVQVSLFHLCAGPCQRSRAPRKSMLACPC